MAYDTSMNGKNRKQAYSGTQPASRKAGKVRVTSIEPGAVDSELKFGSGDEASRNNIVEFYKTAIPADSVARAIAFAIEQPADVGINEIVLRPLTQAF